MMVGHVLAADETKVFYHVDDEETPYLVKVMVPPERVTLLDFKKVLSLTKPSYKFFFKSMDDDFGVVKEEIVDDEAKLPLFRGRVVAWLVSADGSNVSDGSTSQITEVSGGSILGHSHHGHGHGHHGRGIPHERLGVIGDSRPPSFHGMGGGMSDICGDTTTCTETESVISSRRGGHRYMKHGAHSQGHHHHHHHCGCDSSTVVTSDPDTTSFIDSEEDEETTSRISTTTDETSVSRIHANRHRRRRRRHRMPSISRTSSISSITDSTMSLNIITVTLNLDTVNFLGISIVGQSNKNGDGGIYVGSIMKGGAVALDARIEPGDMILQVNDINFENMSNDEAVRVLREAVQKPGPIKLVVAKCWDPSPKGYFTIPRSEPVRPIDPGAWVAHTEAARASSEYPMRPPSVSTLTSTSSSITSSLPESERPLALENTPLSVDMDMLSITKAMASNDSGLDVRDRMWLKITIPNAFLGSDVVDWLYSHVHGFQDRSESRKYATQLLKQGFIKHTVNKNSFSERCYYIFGEMVSCMSGISGLRLEDDHDNDRDTILGSLPAPDSNSPSPWHTSSHHQVPPYTGNYIPPTAQFVPWGSDTVNYGVFGACPISMGSRGNGIDGSLNSGSGGENNLLGERHSASPGASSDPDQMSQRSGPIPISSFKQYHQPREAIPVSCPQVPFAPHMDQLQQLPPPASGESQRNGVDSDRRELSNSRDNSGSDSSGHSSLNTQTTRETAVGLMSERNGGENHPNSENGQLDLDSEHTANDLEDDEDEQLIVEYHYTEKAIL